MCAPWLYKGPEYASSSRCLAFVNLSAALRQASWRRTWFTKEVGATATMVERARQRFDLTRGRIAADVAYGAERCSAG